jgi:hypothetical protein
MTSQRNNREELSEVLLLIVYMAVVKGYPGTLGCTSIRQSTIWCVAVPCAGCEPQFRLGLSDQLFVRFRSSLRDNG